MKRLFKKIPLFAVAALIIMVISAGLTGCTKTTTVTVQATTTTSAITGSITIVNGSTTKILTLADIKAMPSVSGSTGDITSSGTIEGPTQYKGVALADILNTAGGMTADNALRITAKDGYSMTMSYKQVMEGAEFPTYDLTTGKEVDPAGKITVFLAYERDGSPIDDTVGPLRVGIMAPGQVTDGHWWVKWAQKLEVISLQQPWTLNLEGAINQSIDKASFESGAAPGCHGSTWTDAQGHVWAGMPLWYLISYVDDDTTMGPLNNAVWDAGFDIHLANANGDMVVFSAQTVKKNDNIILAFQEDGQPLPSTQWPLALVGSGVDSQHQIGMITKIKLIFPTTTTTAK